MSQIPLSGWLDRPVDNRLDHILGPVDAGITLLEYGSYACPYSRSANDNLATIRDRFGDRMRDVFRQRPTPNHDLALRAAELAEQVDPARFWDIHIALMTRSATLTEEDLRVLAAEFGIHRDMPEASQRARRANARVEADIASAQASGVHATPTFFINDRRYDGPWDEHSVSDAMLCTLGHRVRVATLDFVSWGPSAGLLLLLSTLLALVLTNSPLGPGFEAFWHHQVGFVFGDSGFQLSLRHWINDALLTVFFLVVGLEIKRELSVGHLSSLRSAALPIAAAIGGMIVPAALYLLLIPAGPWTAGWGVPMATDTAFAIAIIAMMGSRVPVELRVFLTAAAIVDDIGAILVVAACYSGTLHPEFLATAALVLVALAWLNHSRVYRALPYVMLGILLWASVHASGLHATLAGVLLAFFIPTRPPPNLTALLAQADVIVASEQQHLGHVLRHGPSLPALRALDAIHERLESPADRVLRHVGTRSTYLVLPIFALANAGLALTAQAWSGHGALFLAITAGLVIGKPGGLILTSWLAVRTGLAEKPDAYSWMQLGGAGVLAGIGFTMSLFIAGQAFPNEADFSAAKLAVFSASLLSAIAGASLLWWAAARRDASEQ